MSTLLVLLQVVSNFSNRVDVNTVLRRSYDVKSCFKKRGRWGRDCGFKHRMRTTRRSVVASWHIVEMYDVPPSGRGPLYTSVPEW